MKRSALFGNMYYIHPKLGKAPLFYYTQHQIGSATNTL